MGKPRMIILIRHAQSEGNKNREIHQSIPDHRVKLTPEGQKQALEAGRRLRELLHADDTLHFFTSPYRRTRETTEGILSSLTSDDPSPSPFPRSTIKVYEEPRLREQDFGNFQPCTAEMERMWQERADYGHFFYRIPNGESAADAYDRISGFNESLWRLFGEDDFASVCVLVTHGLMTRIFLMKWYHFSVEYFEDLRNVNHCEFVIMRQREDNGKYLLQNKLRTWSELKQDREREKARERASVSDAGALAAVTPGVDELIPIRRQWGGCPNGCNHQPMKFWRKRPMRQYTKEVLEKQAAASDSENSAHFEVKPGSSVEVSIDKPPKSQTNNASPSSSSPSATPSHISLNFHADSNSPPDSQSEDEPNGYQRPSSTFFPNNPSPLSRPPNLARIGRADSYNGAPNRVPSDNETDYFGNQYDIYDPSALDSQQGESGQHQLQNDDENVTIGQGVANSLGDRDDENDQTDDAGKQGLLEDNENDYFTTTRDFAYPGDAVLESEKQHDQSIRGSVY
ncbi:hypothetical protein AJ79_07974 [Helicocarpus griseus UAMH5409]|uniref:Phosphoglycerate mutase n=1 Tax=Helicocarpus griseus UAMH5409 TaxID=1447875 RepID=A0A2B7WXL1_9EURO|nr:hypothetical protein AJ79_07974 [Helicocarpus griseus UAMH5409]